MNASGDYQLPPHSAEAERGIISSLMQAADDEKLWEQTIGIVQEKLTAPGREMGCQFYDLALRDIYRVMIDLDASRVRPDLVMLSTRLRDLGLLEGIGGVACLSQLFQSSPSPAQVSVYADEVLGKWRLRESIRVAGLHMDRAMDCAGDPSEVLSKFESDVLALGDQGELTGAMGMADLIPEAMRMIEISAQHRNQGLPVGLKSPWSFFNKRMMGFLPRQVTLLAGESSLGKTSWMLNLAIHLAVNCGVPVGILSAESGKEELTIRLLCILAQANGKQVHSGYVSEADLKALIKAASRLFKSPIIIDDRPGLTPLDIRVRSRRLCAAHGCKIIMLDHIHECDVPEARNDLKMAGMLLMKSCRWVARTLHVPMLVLAQLNREGQREMARSKRRRPQKSDLRESGYLEQMADNIGILYLDRAAMKDDEDEAATDRDEDTWPVNMEIVKQRNGPTGSVEFTFHRPTFRFLDRYRDRGSVDEAERKIEIEDQEFMTLGKLSE